MKIKKFLAILVFLVVIIVSQSSFVSAKEKINKFYVDIEINPDSSINVKESIEYDFYKYSEHGIYREIPIKHKTKLGLNRNIRISDISVRDELGNKYNFTKEKTGRYLKIKIGDADKLITGVHTYEISYKVSGAFNFFDTHDELYWNATGNEWMVPIDSTKVMVHSPNIQKIRCFRGFTGSNETCDKSFLNDSYAEFADSGFLRTEGMTFVIGLKKGTVREPSSLEKIFWFLNWFLIDNFFTISLPIIVIFGFFLNWFVYGRDYKIKGPIIPRWEVPDNLAPAEAGIIFDGKFGSQDFAAMIIDLAVRGYISIEQLFDDYEFTYLKENSEIYKGSSLKEYEKYFLSVFFLGNKKTILSSKTNNFKKEYETLLDKIYKKVTPKYFARNPKKLDIKYATFGAWLMVFSLIPALLFNSLVALLGMLLGLSMMVGYGKLMVKRSRKGQKIKKELDGLKMYLVTAEKRTMEMLNAPEKNAEHFEQLLPYAVALGAVGRWSKQFEGLIQENPKWFNGGVGYFDSRAFGAAMQSFSNSTNNTINPQAPSGRSGFSSSGGFSGGGFGGGGGGSW